MPKLFSSAVGNQDISELVNLKISQSEKEVDSISKKSGNNRQKSKDDASLNEINLAQK